MKFQLIFFISVLIVSLTFLFTVSDAQPPQFRAQVDRIITNNQFRMQMQMQSQMLQMMNLQGGEVTPQEYNFLIVFRDSIKKEFTSAIYTDSVTRNRFIVFVDKKFKKSDTNRYKKIYPSQTIYIAKEIPPMTVPGHGSPKVIGQATFYPGICKDSCWMFKVVSGALNAYSYVCEEDGLSFNPSTLVGIQLNDGPIIKYSEDNLKQLVGQDINALEAIQKKNLYKAIKKYNRDREKEAKK